jgi:hypothetical protein
MQNKLSALRNIIIVFILALAFSSCRRCIDCTPAQFNADEEALVYYGRTTIQYSNGTDTVSALVSPEIVQSKNRDCGSGLIKLNCMSTGQANVYVSQPGAFPINQIQNIVIQKSKIEKGVPSFQCTNFTIGNIFSLNLDNNFKLMTPLYGDFQVNTLSNYSFNGMNYSDVQEVINNQHSGVPSELTRAVYHHGLGVLELTYSNPSDTWVQVP